MKLIESSRTRTASEGHATVGKTRDSPRFLVKFVAYRIPGRRLGIDRYLGAKRDAR